VLRALAPVSSRGGDDGSGSGDYELAFPLDSDGDGDLDEIQAGPGTRGEAMSTLVEWELAFVPGVKGDAFYTSMQYGVEGRAEALGASVDVQASDKFDATTQTPLVEAVAAQQPDALLTAPTDTKAMYAPIKQVADTGAKVVLVDTTLEDPSVAVSGIASDYEKLGQVAAKELIELIGGQGSVMMIGLQPGISTLDAGQAGFESVVEGTPGVEYLGIQYAQNDQAKVAGIISATLAMKPDLAGVFTPSGPDQAGVVNALKRAGKVGEVKIVSADAQPPQVQQLEAGEVQALVGQKPFDMGVQGVDQAIAALDGEPTTESITTGI
jgi:ribose transport system substrate-binding protein